MPDGHERQDNCGRQRREGDDAALGRVAVRVQDRHDILVAGRRDRGLAVHPRLGLQHEMQVQVGAVRLAEVVDREDQQHQADTPQQATATRVARAGVLALHPVLGLNWADGGLPRSTLLQIGTGLCRFALGYTPLHPQRSPRRPRLAGPSTREESPQGRAPAGTSGAVTAILAIVALLTLGLILRFIIAYVLLPGSGFPNDLGAFQAWGNDIAQHGPIGFYDRAGFLDYPPVYLLLLGLVSFLTGGSIGEGVKLIPMLADLGLAAVVWVMVREQGVSGRRAFIAALIVVINPITWFNSAIWGQADAVGSILLLLGLRELQKDRREAASVLAVLAALTKLQLGILGFVVVFVVLRRSLAPKTGEPSPERLLTSLGAGLVTAALVCLPFTGLDPAGVVNRLGSVSGILTLGVGLVAGIGAVALGRRYLPIANSARRAVASLLIGAATVIVFAGMVFDAIVGHLLNTFGEYPYLTLNAYNPWSLVGDSTGAAMSRSLSWIHDAPWSDATSGASSGASGPGFIVGPFPVGVYVVGLVVAAVLGAAAYLAWSRKSTSAVAETDGSSGLVPQVASGRGGSVGR